MRNSQSAFIFRKDWLASALLVSAATAGLAAQANAANLLDNLKGQAQQQMGGGSQSGTAGSMAPATGGLAGSAGGIGGALGGMGLPAMSSNNRSNAAGVLAYCAKNNYLSASSAQNVKDKLLGKAGLSNTTAQQDNGYRAGASGLLQGSNGHSFNLDDVKGKAKTQACGYVLDHAKSFI